MNVRRAHPFKIVEMYLLRCCVAVGKQVYWLSAASVGFCMVYD